ncbi:MAG TPA: murein biosynthesis integral membrane protein MurJ [Erysipelotrichaceae bacterium]|nr:murein biosynthesis integral membrane protein MurJ [Erysipelotrichaceae bacterium]
MKKNAFLLFIFLLISRFLGLIRESFLSAYYATTYVADAYVAASQIPNVIFAIISAGLVSTFIPIYSRIINKEGEERAENYLNNILSLVFVFTIIVIGLGLIFTEELVYLLRPGFKDQQLLLTIKLLKITLFALLFNGVGNILNGYQQYHDRFLVGPVGGFLMNFVVITSIIISAKTDLLVLAYGLVIAALAQLLVTYFVARSKSSYRFKPGINLKDPYLKPMLLMAMPIILGSSIGQINATVDGAFASNLGVGASSTLNYASKISGAVYGLFVSSITTVMYPTIIRQASAGKIEEMKVTMVKILNSIAIIIVPATVGLIVLSKPVVNLIHKRGSMTEAEVILIASVLVFLSLGLIAQSLKDVMVRTFYSLHDSMSPVFSSVITVGTNIILNIILVPTMGVKGLALATTISGFVGFIALFIVLNRKINGIPMRELLITFGKILFASIIMGVVAHFGYDILISINLDYKLALFGSAGVAAALYAGILYFMKIEEFDELWEMAFSKIRVIIKR